MVRPARPQRVKVRDVPLRYVEGLKEAMTRLAGIFSILLGRPGLLLMCFEIEGDKFPDFLHAAIDEHLARNFNPDEFSDIDAAIFGVVLIDVETHGSVGEAERVQGGRISHGTLSV
jgi:hypothetical protein